MSTTNIDSAKPINYIDATRPQIFDFFSICENCKFYPLFQRNSKDKKLAADQCATCLKKLLND